MFARTGSWRRASNCFSALCRLTTLAARTASPVGAAVTFPVTSTLSVETDVSYRRGEGRIHALSLSTSLVYSLPRVGLKMPMKEKLDLRTDARWFKLMGQGSDQFRVAQGISFGVGKR